MDVRRRPRVAVLPGDDAAPEAVYPSLELLQGMDLPVEWVLLPDGATLAKEMSPAEAERLVIDTAEACDTVLFGATNGTTPGVGYLRWGKLTFANVRPIRWRPGFNSPLRQPEGIDYIIIRENIEDLYLGLEGDLQELLASDLPSEPRNRYGVSLEKATGRYALKVLTRERTEQVARFACQLALQRKQRGYPGKVTCSSKYNMLPRTDGLFRHVVRDVVAQYPDVAYEEFIVDDFARRIVQSPHGLDVVVLPNLYGDILADEAAGTIGGLGLAPSGCYGEDYAYFEPVHGTAPDIAGQHIINPTATLLSAALMLEYLGLEEEGARLEQAVADTVAAGDSLTPDQGGSSKSSEFVAAVRSRL
jgi:isocitrate/isopropylmalate dehydrogenase